MLNSPFSPAPCRLLGLLLLGISLHTPLMAQIVDQEELKRSILEKVQTLTNYISLIADKDQDDDLRQDARDLAVGLFVSPDKIVEVSSIRRPKPFAVLVPDYFQRIYAYNYDRVKITYFEVAHVSDLEKGADGRLYGTAAVYQKFEAFDREGNLVYQDKTTKNISIRVEEIERYTGEASQTYLDIKLGNIKVHETR